MTPKEIAAKLTPAERATVLRAGMMISGRMRCPWRVPEGTYRGLIAANVCDCGGYLTPLGLLVRSELETNNVE